MNKYKLINILNSELQRQGLSFKLDDKSMDTLALDVTRVADEECTEIVDDIKCIYKVNINSIQRILIRKQLLGYPVKPVFNFNITPLSIGNKQYDKAYKLLSDSFTHNAALMTSSLVARIKSNFLNESIDTTEKYLAYIHEEQKAKSQLIILEINADKNYTVDNIIELVRNGYNHLSNYHHIAIVFKDGIKTINWSLIANVALYMEQLNSEHNFKVYEKKHKAKRIQELVDFLKGNKYIKLDDHIIKQVKSFYSAVAYGFQFEDLFITKNGKTKVLIMQKVELDETPKKCPSCLQTMVRGNSYNKLLIKSFECINPDCPSRSKIGRGKRYTYYSAKTHAMLARNSSLDIIDDTMYTSLRHDIVNNITIEQLIRLYSWADDTVEFINTPTKYNEYKGRKIVHTTYYDFKQKQPVLPLVELLKAIANNITFDSVSYPLDSKKLDKVRLFLGNSTDIVPYMKINVDGAVTSPPYYNAREYSQWSNLLCYLIDMLVNAKAVYNSLSKNGIYIYNIADVIGQDNIYVNSTISKRRQMLGFYSIIIFEILGYKTITDTIWYKGEVQSKRNSTPNHISGYLKPINSYEHCLVFSKNKAQSVEPTKVLYIKTVKKINSKGVNTLGHTAPYPEEIPKLITQYVPEGKTILDPYLGSGTTIVALQSNYHVVGIEQNKKFYQIALNRSILND